MSLPLRIQLENGMYHIIVRGNNKQKIFINTEDYLFFLQVLNKACHKFSVVIYTYCLMPNHYHLHIETKKANLIKFMHWLNIEYVINFNIKYKRTGHLFEGRYKSILIDKDTYCLALNRYIHLNPVKAGLVKYPEDYQWSSYNVYLTEVSVLTTFNINFLLEYFSKNKKEAIKNYRNYIYEGIKYRIDPLEERIKGDLILGSNDYIKNIEKRVGRKQLDARMYTQLIKLRKQERNG